MPRCLRATHRCLARRVLKQTLARRPLALAVPRTQVATTSSRGNLSHNKLGVKEKAAARMRGRQNAVCISTPAPHSARSKAARSKAAPHLLAGFRCAAGRECWRVRNAPRAHACPLISPACSAPPLLSLCRAPSAPPSPSTLPSAHRAPTVSSPQTERRGVAPHRAAHTAHSAPLLFPPPTPSPSPHAAEQAPYPYP